MKNSISNSSLWGIFAILAALNVWDAASTAVLVSKFGHEVEANPVMRHAIYHYGISGLYMMKFAVVSFLGLGIAWFLRYQRNHTTSVKIIRSLWVLNALLAFIVVNNIILVVKTINI